jgi:DNA-binding NtrC family response regulator
MKTVLVIDDEAPIREIVRYLLERAGYDVLDADSAEAGLALFRKHGPSLVITDILMPNKTGLEILAAFQGLDPAVKLIVMSGGDGRDLNDALATARRHGPVETLAKPFRPKELLEIVRRVLATTDDKSPI